MDWNSLIFKFVKPYIDLVYELCTLCYSFLKYILQLIEKKIIFEFEVVQAIIFDLAKYAVLISLKVGYIFQNLFLWFPVVFAILANSISFLFTGFFVILFLFFYFLKSVLIFFFKK